MSARLDDERALVARYLPPDTQYLAFEGRDLWLFKKLTQVGITFEMAVYYEPDEIPAGYCVRLISPEIEATWRNAHIGHIFSDGTLCFGGTAPSARCRYKLTDAYAKACVWAEGMAVMIASHLGGIPTEFPFSNNNTPGEVGA